VLNPFKLTYTFYTISEKDLFTMVGQVDAFVYLLFMKYASIFFSCRKILFSSELVAIVNLAILVPIYATTPRVDPDNDDSLLVRATSIYAIDDQVRTGLMFGFSLLTLAVVAYLIRLFKRKVDRLAKTSLADDEDHEDQLKAQMSIMIKGVP